MGSLKGKVSRRSLKPYAEVYIAKSIVLNPEGLSHPKGYDQFSKKRRKPQFDALGTRT